MIFNLFIILTNVSSINYNYKTDALYTLERLCSLQLAGDGENDKGRFLGHNGLSPAPTLAAQGGRGMAPSSFQFDKIPMRETAASAAGLLLANGF